MFKKSLLTLVIALTLVVGVSKAHAYSLEDAMADIASLKTQITELKDQLSAAVITTKTSSTVTAVPVTTEPIVSTEKTVIFSSSANILPNAKGNDVKVLQQALKDKGYYTGEVTGNFGAVTEKAVRAFQTANKIASTGVVGPTTKSLLTTPTGNTCAPTATFLPASSTPSQYIASGTGAGQSQLVYKITIPSSCHSIKITELKLSNTGTPGVITSATIGSVTVPFTSNNIANFAGLNLNVPNTPAGLTITANLSYPMVGLGGVTSGTVSSKVKITYLKYTNMTTGASSALNINTALSPNMMLVKNQADIAISNAVYPVLKNNIHSNIASINLGPYYPSNMVKVISIPLQIKITSGPTSVLNTSANSVLVKDFNGNIIPTTNPVFTQINPSTFRTTITFSQPLFTSYTTASLQVYALFSGLVPASVPQNPSTSGIQVTVQPPENFSWIDYGANNNTPFTSANLTYYLDYPLDFALAGASTNP